MPSLAKSFLLRTYPSWQRFIPPVYYPYRVNGSKIFLNVRESQMMLQRALGRYEPSKTAAIKHFLREGQTFIDIGANKGDFSLLASRIVGQYGKVIAFEPHPENCQWLERSVAKNRYHNISVQRLAISDKRGTASLYLGQKSGFHTLLPGKEQRDSGEISVSTELLDDLLSDSGIRKVDAIKIDVEGAEKMVLDGAHRTLTDNKGIVLFLDIHPHLGIDSVQVCRRLEGLGFSLFEERSPFNIPAEIHAGLQSVLAYRTTN